MRKVLTICAVVTMILAISNIVQATTTDYTVAPSDLGDKDSWKTGTLFGYDHPEVTSVDYTPIGSTVKGGAPGYGDSAFWADVQGSANPGGRDYCALRLSAQDILGAGTTIGNLSSISYWSNWVSGVNWQIKIYTDMLDGQTSGWYGHRFNFSPASATAGWAESSTDTLQVYNLKTGQGGAEISPNLTLAQLQSAGTYNLETIMFIDISCSFMTASPAGDTYLDGVELSGNGNIANINLVPEPATMVLLGLGGLLLRKRK